MWTLPSGRNGARGPWTCPVAARPVSATAPAPALGGKGAALAPATSSYGCHHLVGDAIKAAAPRPRRCRVPHVLHSSLPGSLLAKKKDAATSLISPEGGYQERQERQSRRGRRLPRARAQPPRAPQDLRANTRGDGTYKLVRGLGATAILPVLMMSICRSCWSLEVPCKIYHMLHQGYFA